jgi:hypothetical protein
MSNYTELMDRLRIEPTASQFLNFSDLFSTLVQERKQAADAIEALQRENAELRKDAQRYRMLRNCGVDSYEACGSGENSMLNAMPPLPPKEPAMASRRARERQDAYNAKHHPERWQDERDDDDNELPEPEEETPVNTNH